MTLPRPEPHVNFDTHNLHEGDVVVILRHNSPEPEELRYEVNKDHLVAGHMSLPLSNFAEGAVYKVMIERQGLSSTWVPVGDFRFMPTPRVEAPPLPEGAPITTQPPLRFSSPRSPRPRAEVRGEICRMVNDVRLDFGDGQGTLGEVADKILDIIYGKEGA